MLFTLTKLWQNWKMRKEALAMAQDAELTEAREAEAHESDAGGDDVPAGDEAPDSDNKSDQK